jgi:predicted membrane metal-binding protein
MQGDPNQAIGGGRLHEDLSRDDEVIGASDRGFGLTIAGVCGLVGAIRLALGHDHAVWWLAAAGIAMLFALFWPVALAPLNRLWLRLGLLLYKVVNPVAMGLVFFTTVVPIGLVMRALGKDPLRLRRDPGAASYWIPREPPGPAPDTMKNQF